MLTPVIEQCVETVINKQYYGFPLNPQIKGNKHATLAFYLFKLQRSLLITSGIKLYTVVLTHTLHEALRRANTRY